MATLLVLYGEKDKQNKETMKKLLFLGIAQLLVCVSVNGQIGITRNGQLKTLFGQWHGYEGRMETIMGYQQWDCPMPKYISGYNRVTIYDTVLKYDNYNETWKVERVDKEVIFFDSVGKIIKSNTNRTFWGDSISINFDYEGSRLTGIGDSKVLYANNRLSAIKFKVNVGYYNPMYQVFEYRFTWAQNGTVSQISKFKEGNLDKSWRYQITNSGRSIIIVDNRGYKHLIERDSHGGMVHWKQSGEKSGKVYMEFFYENKYDDKGNLIEQLKYQKKASGKYYENGYRYHYEYDFYE